MINDFINHDFINHACFYVFRVILKDDFSRNLRFIHDMFLSLENCEEITVSETVVR